MAQDIIFMNLELVHCVVIRGLCAVHISDIKSFNIKFSLSLCVFNKL